MKFGISIPNCGGDYADARLVAEVAYEAEEAGWDGFFVWDHIGDKWGDEVSDPWVMLTAIAMRTQRMKLGTMVTPVTRRRPWKLAREIVTLDQITNGRMILGVGIGGGVEYVNYHEPEDSKVRGEMLDEALAILVQLWSGEHISYHGRHYQLDNVRHLPRPIQQPRIPIWVGGAYPNKKPMRRAAQWDGACPITRGTGLSEQMPLETARECFQYILSQRDAQHQPYDLVHWGILERKDNDADIALVTSYAEAGATWWVENITWKRGSLQANRERIHQGPPALSKEQA